ncbi:MAG TPA: phospholipase D family protein [Terriglobales bacterium]|nr:phospholipase D family protein [Terriglobales bacterium]
MEGRTESRAVTDTEGTRLGRAVAPLKAKHPGLTGIRTLGDGREAFAARTVLAREAERSIDAQYYIWHGDVTGTLLFDELRAAAERGVRVRLLLDDNTTQGLDEMLAGLAAQPNIEVRLFNPFVHRSHRWIGYLTDFGRLNRRMHNKSFTVDNQATILGGRNIGDEYFGAGDSGLFVDLDVLAIGGVVSEVSRDFDRYWASGSSYPAERVLPPLTAARAEELAAAGQGVEASAAAQRYMEAVRALPIVAQMATAELALQWVEARLVSDDPAKGLGKAETGDLVISRLGRLLGHPKERLDLVSAYFVPTRTGVEHFAAMVGRGVRVNVVTNALEATDVPLVHAGYAHRRRALLRAGVRLWEMHGGAGDAARWKTTGRGGGGSTLRSSGTSLHAKTFVLDGERAFIGSFNFDPRSARLNTELGLVIADAEFARGMEAGLAATIPRAAYEVQLSGDGQLRWIERGPGGEENSHSTEPGAGFWERAGVALLSVLPMEWLL